MFEHTYLDNYYSVSAPSNGGSAEMAMITGHSDVDKIQNYYINDDVKKGPVEHFSIYSDGLVIFIRQMPELIEIYSNKEFDLRDDGKFYLTGNNL